MELLQGMMSSLNFSAEPIGTCLKVLGGLQLAKYAYGSAKVQVEKLRKKLK